MQRLEQALAADFAEGWRAEEILLVWLLGLPADVDPDVAATVALSRIEAFAGPGPGRGELGRLRAFLEETMSWPRPVLASLMSDRRGRTRRPS